MRKSLKQLIQNIFSAERNEHEPDRNLIITIGIIVVFGLVMLSSASSVVAYAEFGDSYHYLKHQLVGLALGVMAFFFFSRVDYHRWRKYAFGLLIFSVFLLSLVFVPGLGKIVNGSRSWIEIFGQSLQPSEFVKLSFLLYLAAWLESRGKNLADFHQGIGPFIIVLGVIAGLILLQPDFGTLFIIIITSFVVYFVSGGSLKHIIITGLIGIIGFTALIFTNEHQLDRFRCYKNPDFSPQDKCYQLRQSLIAVGSGGILGRGLGASRQKYMYIPEVQNDFIFSIIAEETGLIVSGLLVLLFIYLFYKGIAIAQKAPDGFGRNLAVGIVAWIVFQAILNIGGIINGLPMTGVPLPFISLGGSAMVASLAAVGILVNISKQTR
ncbi:putative lipid II flippase FtsW [Patescibacteria group bacterium]|nr:putative lipid II flippase FtsW [Patescibacteria group bacterium]MBU4600716.1 putative lipid II flippase FtsW [Patescibacteria group bacterium]MCG2698160.1 putative lipid II flippase FtsW [Candidatus Parcubacteria bacterium]